MEKRLILTIVLCMLIAIASSSFFRTAEQSAKPKPPIRSPEPATLSSAPTASTDGKAPGPSTVVEPPGGEKAASEVPPSFPPREVKLEDEYLELTFSSLGASLTTAILLQHLEHDPAGKLRREEWPRLRLIAPDLESGAALTLRLQDWPLALDKVHWNVVESSARAVRFSYPLAGGRTNIEKVVRLTDNPYLLDVEIVFSGAPWTQVATDVRAIFLGPDRIRADTSRAPNQRVTGYANSAWEYAQVERKTLKPIVTLTNTDANRPLWTGLESNFFAFVIRPKTQDPTRPWDGFEYAPPPRAGIDVAEFERLSKQVQPYQLGFLRTVRVGETAAFEVFLGPKDRTLLNSYAGSHYDDLINYGYFGWLVRTFLALLSFFKSITFSYGIAIILLTVLVKLLLHPINKKNQSMMQRQQKKMAKIQPQMQELRQRHKNDSMKANREIQQLMREHGVNPAQMLGGCLLIFLQLPIWIGLINTFSLAIELRLVPFLWIDDLTRPDELFQLPFTIPFLGSAFNLLPVLYVAVTIINQNMMPKSPDPNMQQQQNLMKYMLVAFGFIFYSFPAGLLLYFLTSSALGILEQKIIKLELAREGA